MLADMGLMMVCESYRTGRELRGISTDTSIGLTIVEHEVDGGLEGSVQDAGHVREGLQRRGGGVTDVQTDVISTLPELDGFGEGVSGADDCATPITHLGESE